MKKVVVSLFLFISCCIIANAQSIHKKDIYNLPIPNNISECFKVLDKTIPDTLVYLIKTLKEDSIYFNKNFQDKADFFHAWKIYDGSKLTKYFNKLGLSGSYPIYETILISYHRYLNKEKIKLNEQIVKYQTQQKKDHEIYLAKLEKDSINGIYIPKDLKDCFVQLDKQLSSANREGIKKLKNQDATIEYHHDLGMWIRNNWGLWGGSRLQKYMLDKKVSQPDAMSALILKFYYDWLNNKNADWIRWMQ